MLVFKHHCKQPSQHQMVSNGIISYNQAEAITEWRRLAENNAFRHNFCDCELPHFWGTQFMIYHVKVFIGQKIVMDVPNKKE